MGKKFWEEVYTPAFAQKEDTKSLFSLGSGRKRSELGSLSDY